MAKKLWTVDWNQEGARGRGIKVIKISHFDARGMLIVYGRGDHWMGSPRQSAHMDVWLTGDGRVLARFSSRSRRIEPSSFEVVGLPHPPLPNGKRQLSEGWVPENLRKAYNDWIISQVLL